MKKIKIHNDIWTVDFVDEYDERLLIETEFLSTKNLGMTSYATLSIVVSDDLPSTLKKSVLIHELAHAYIESYSIKIDGEEEICDFMGLYGEEIITQANKLLG